MSDARLNRNPMGRKRTRSNSVGASIVPGVCTCTKSDFPPTLGRQQGYILDPRNWSCSTCTTTESMWACLNCGHIGCGIYTNKHAESHYRQSKHRYVIEINDKSVYCYACNGYVLDDEKLFVLADLRAKLNAIQRDWQPSRTRSGRFLRSKDAEEAAKKTTKDEVGDKMYAAICHWRLVLMSKAFYAWRNYARERVEVRQLDQKLVNSGQESNDNDKAQPTKRKKVAQPGQTGLRNLGNTCFMNSCMQSLSYTKPFRQYFLQLRQEHGLQRQLTQDVFANMTTSLRKRKQNATISHHSDPAEISEYSLTQNTQNLLRVMWSESSKWPVVSCISPSAFLAAIWHWLPEFRGFMQHDAQEFLCTYLDKLDAELRSKKLFFHMPAEDHSLHTIVSIFAGNSLSLLNCKNCGQSSSFKQPFTFLTLSTLIEPHEPVTRPQGETVKGGRFTLDDEDSLSDNGQVNLLDCLRQFTTVEHLDDKTFMCERCQSRQYGFRRTIIDCLPDVLLLHVNRIKWDGIVRQKIQTHIQFPTTGLDMSEFLAKDMDNNESSTDDNIYDLCSVINHHGRHFGSGHYTAYCHNEDTKSWLLFSDGRVASATEDEVRTSQAYLLFYIRRKLKSMPDPTVVHLPPHTVVGHTQA